MISRSKSNLWRWLPSRVDSSINAEVIGPTGTANIKIDEQHNITLKIDTSTRFPDTQIHGYVKILTSSGYEVFSKEFEESKIEISREEWMDLECFVPQINKILSNIAKTTQTNQEPNKLSIEYIVQCKIEKPVVRPSSILGNFEVVPWFTDAEIEPLVNQGNIKCKLDAKTTFGDVLLNVLQKYELQRVAKFEENIPKTNQT